LFIPFLRKHGVAMRICDFDVPEIRTITARELLWAAR
jgi:hypothetical protein